MSRTLAVAMALTFALTALAGCFSDKLPLTPLAATVQLDPVNYTFEPAVAYDGAGTSVPDPTGILLSPARLPHVVESMVPGSGGEPNLGVTSKGTIVVTSLDKTMRSIDQGRTWTLATDFTVPDAPTTQDQFSTSDPMLWLDPDTDRIFVPQMHPAVACTWLQWSDGDGAPGSWHDRPMDCAVPGPIITFDHQKWMTAKPGPGVPAPPMPAYPNVVYMCVNRGFEVIGQSVFGTSCMTSFDGGLTFAFEREIGQVDENCSNVNGHPAAWPDGTVGVVLGNLGAECKRPLTIAITETNGLTWDLRVCKKDARQLEIDADITVTKDGTAYIMYRDGDQLVHLLRSKDKFRTCDEFKVAPPDQTLNTFTAITSGDDGRLAMAYVGTRDAQEPGATPSNATAGSVWHLFVTTVTNAESASPTFVTQQVTPREDPVQVGCVWLGGGGGGPYRCRNLLDFIDMVHDKDGRWYVAMTDGCVPRNGCTGTPAEPDFQSRDRQIGVMVEDAGPSLFAEKGMLPALGLQWPDWQKRGQDDPSEQPPSDFASLRTDPPR